MDWRVFLTVFLSVFVAELGDKTQLATMSFAAGSGSRWVVFAAAATALVASTAIAVLLGVTLARWVPVLWLKRGAGMVFLTLGLLYLFFPGGAD